SCMGRKVCRGAQRALHNLALQIGYNQILGLQVLVCDSARLDHDQTFATINSTDIAKRRQNQSLSNQLNIRFEHLYTEIVQQQHSFLGGLEAAVHARESSYTRAIQPIKIERQLGWNNDSGSVARSSCESQLLEIQVN